MKVIERFGRQAFNEMAEVIAKITNSSTGAGYVCRHGYQSVYLKDWPSVSKGLPLDEYLTTGLFKGYIFSLGTESHEKGLLPIKENRPSF